MPISSGAGGRRVGRDSSRTRPSASISSARSTPNLAQPGPSQPGQSDQGRTGRRMIDAPPKVETRRQLGSQTLYGSRPPWATDEDAPSPKKEQQTPPPPQQQQPQPPFYPAGGDLLHGEVARMRRLKAARELYKSPHSRRKHNTGSVDDLLRDCAVSDHSHSHSPSPVRRAPSVASSLARSTTDLQTQRERSTSRPGPSTRSTGVGTMDGPSGNSTPRRHLRNDGSIVSDDSLDDGDEGKKRAAANSGGRRRSRQRQSRTSRGTSPPPPQKPLYVDTGCDATDWGPSGKSSPPARQSFARAKMPPGLKPAADRKYVPPPPVRQPSPSVKRHDCLPSDNPPFRARPMPDFRRVSPSPGRNRSRSQSPAQQAALVQTSSATTSGYRSGGGSSPSGRRNNRPRRRRSMDEDSLTEGSSGGLGERSVATEILQPSRATEDRRPVAMDAMDSGFRSLEPEPVQQQRGGGSGRSSLLLVPDKVLKDRSVTDIDLDEIFGTSGQSPQQQKQQRAAPPAQAYAKTVDFGDNSGEVNERIQYWLKRNIYFHSCEPAPDSQQQRGSKYATSPPSSEMLRSMSEHRPQQPRLEILVQRTDVQQLPLARAGAPPRHVSTVEYPVRKFQQLPYGYLSPSSSEDDGSADEEGGGVSSRVPGAEIVRQALVYARSTGADSGFWFSTENGGAPRSLGTAYNAAPAQSALQPRPASAASSSGGSSRGGGRVRALASRFNQQQPTVANGDYLSSYQQPVTPARSQPISNGHAVGSGRQSGAPVVASQLRRVTPARAAAPATGTGSASASADSKTFYFGDSALVSKREQREHWASDYFNRPKIEIIDRSGGQ